MAAESDKPPGHKPAGRQRRRKGSNTARQAATSARSLARKARGKSVLDLRLTGLSVRKIAEQVGVSKSEVQRQLSEALTEIGATQESKKEVQAMQLERLDTWLTGLSKRAQRGDDKAVTTALKIEERRAKMLGTDAPTEQRLTILGQVNWVFDAIREELGEDAAQRVFRRLSETGGPPAPDGGG